MRSSGLSLPSSEVSSSVDQAVESENRSDSRAGVGEHVGLQFEVAMVEAEEWSSGASGRGDGRHRGEAINRDGPAENPGDRHG